ncbi:uncharacterized protein LOC132759067 [Ruditapes philippinarum]|uniref:uncharacterized protein LOC132759067 n=1 Tax=Ruditapes philippinarum TaxID=129788 RepID=UPI00295B76F5|nr:uncharacterized protein LOC132759067 [Ruditapes philippinarum]
MSVFEDYNTTCASYDNQRQPLGADIVVEMLRLNIKKQLKDVHILDAGCGTGNYSKALIEYGVGKVTLMDASSGMLEQTKKKLVNAIENNIVTDVVQNKLPKIPFGNGTFDAVLFSLVLHHLNPRSDGLNDEERPFKELEQTIAEARRVLRNDGVLIIIAQSEDDIRNNWYCQINNDITKKFVTKFASCKQYQDIFDRTGFQCIQKLRLLGTILDDHLNLDGPFQKAWRECDSYWACATDEELNDVMQTLKSLKNKGELDDWVIEHDKVNSHGILTMFLCK